MGKKMEANIYEGTVKGRKVMSVKTFECPYEEEGLCEQDSNHILGYDSCAKEALMFLKTMDMYKERFDQLGVKFDSIDPHVLFEDKDFTEYTEKELAKMSSGTRFFKYLQHMMKKFLDRERTSLIWTMGGFTDDYDKNMLHYRTGKYKNALVRCREMMEVSKAHNEALLKGDHSAPSVMETHPDKFPFRP